MSDTSAALRAAREVQADTLAPELYRQAGEWFNKAKHEYKFKNFNLAKDFADKARVFAEQAELESLRNGGIRSDLTPSELPPPPPLPYSYPEKPPSTLDAAEKESPDENGIKPTGTGGPTPPSPPSGQPAADVPTAPYPQAQPTP